MNKRSTKAFRFALHGVALAALGLLGSQAHALGLGRVAVQSSLGETLKAEIDVTSLTSDEASSLKLSVASPDAYRAAGMDYHAVLAGTHVRLVKRPDGRNMLVVTSDSAVLEPFLDVIVEANWSSGRLVREYTMLFDPPLARTAPAAQAAAPATAPVVGAAPAPSPAPAPRTAPAPMAQAAVAGSNGSNGRSGEVKVRSGDTLTGIAARTQQPGISLDQMLVSLFRGNPQAFMGDNMNRLKSGAVLSVPAADEAAKLSSQQARELIVAQSADFDAYRRRLAGATTAVAEPSSARQAQGQVQARVNDRKQAAGTAPDRLRLTQGGIQASAPEARLSKQAESKATQARLAELARNVDELKKLQNAATPGAPPAAAVAMATAPAPVPAAATAPAPALTAPAVVAALPAAPSAAAATPPPQAASAAAPQRAVPAPLPEPGLLDSLLDNPLLLPAAGVLVALLAGLGAYKLRSRTRRPAGETSFLESRLQPDSFFGASGGQRIDTREAPASSSSSSSMSYSLSQLDAIGDVDPVAEADVYLAYGRDLQAEEILKEAMRATPDRMAIRTKLLEVYAKRRDAKAFELLASQVFNLTRGQGEDWAKAQSLGLGIDAENPMYQPGASPQLVVGATGQVFEPLGASTVPHTVQASSPLFQPAADATLDRAIDQGVDLDLGLDAPVATDAGLPAPTPAELTQPFGTGAHIALDEPTLDMRQRDPGPATLPALPPEPAAADDGGLDFDLASLSHDEPTVALKPPAAPPPAPGSGLDFGDFSIGGEPLTAHEPEDGAPLARKMELAEEFRQIGDLEGARDLLEEVIAKADGALKQKAQGMLDKLA